MATASQLQKAIVTIADNGTESTAGCIEGGLLLEVQLPAGVVGTAMTFQTSWDGVTYQSLEDTSGTAISITIEASKNVNVYSKNIIANYLKVTSGSSETGGPLSIGLVYLMLNK